MGAVLSLPTWRREPRSEPVGLSFLTLQSSAALETSINVGDNSKATHESVIEVS